MCKTENEHLKKIKFEARFQTSMEIRIIYSSNNPSTTRKYVDLRKVRRCVANK